KRYLYIHFPNWSIDLVLRKQKAANNTALVLTKNVAGQPLVKRVSQEAQQAGIEEEMPLVLARALAAQTIAAPFEPLRDFKNLYKLALWCLRFTPLVGIDSELLLAYKRKELDRVEPLYNGLILDITGTERLHKGERALLGTILAKLSKGGINAQAAIAPTIGAAWAHAHYSKHRFPIIAKESLKTSVAPLPVSALRLKADTILALQELGIHTLDALHAIPPKKLMSRFGTLLLKRLDQILGHVEETFRSIHPKESIVTKHAFEIPVTKHAALQTATSSLLKAVVAKLDLQHKKAGTFLITFQGHTEQGDAFTIHKEITLNTATRSLTHIVSVIAPVIEALRLPKGVKKGAASGGLTNITVYAQGVKQAVQQQEDYLQNATATPPAHVFDEFLNNIVSRLGKDHICNAKLHQSYIPERAFSFPSIEDNYSSKRQRHILSANPLNPERILSDRYSQLRRVFYPPFLFAHPEPATTMALLPDTPPSRITWRRRAYKILKGTGPERIFPEWWQADLKQQTEEREYFKVQDETGRWLWIFRNRQTLKWFVHGIWT
ncbi:DNA polymerase Y family protein, partial [Oligoflexia bacterium]|nr:DNA polymerase Y family protein [Oligoflexia bacterium]